MSASLSNIREYLPLDEVDVILYHSRCCDGFGGAWAVWAASIRDDIVVNGCSHSAQPSEIDRVIDMVRDKNVLMIDFSYRSDVLKQIDESAHKFAILDHHPTALKEIQDAELLDRSVLDVEHSGCWLGWRYAYPDEEDELPRFMQFIQDRDLWRWDLPDTEPFTASLYPTVDYDLDEWLKLQDDDLVDQHISDGKIIVKHQNLEIENLARQAISMQWKGYNIRVINSTSHISKLGNVLAKECDFALMWLYDGKRDLIKVSLRSDSEGNNVNVGQIAKDFGGGGHACASGFVWYKSIQELLYPRPPLREELEIDSDDGEEVSSETPLLSEEFQEGSQEGSQEGCGDELKRTWFTLTLVIACGFIGMAIGYVMPK